MNNTWLDRVRGATAEGEDQQSGSWIDAIREKAKEKKKAQERAESIEKTYGSTAYGASDTASQNNPPVRSKATEGTTMRSKLQSALSDVRGAIERQEPQESPLTPAQQAAQQAADQTRHDIDAIQRRVDHLRGVTQSGDLRESRRAEQEIRALQGLYQRATAENQRANDFLSGTRRELVTEDQVRAASDALTQAKSNALSASLRLGSALTVRGQNPFSDTDENIQRMVSEAQEYSASAHAAEQEATATYNKLAGDYQYQKYAGLRMRPDFLMNSYGDAETANRGAESTDVAEIAYARIYGRDHATAKPDNLSGDIYRYVTDDEARLFYYLWNTQGKKAASEYLKSVEYQINERLAAEQQERINKLTETTAGKVYASAASVLLNQGSIIGVVDLTMQNIRRMLGDNRPIDYNTQAQAIGKAAQQIRANVSENLEGNTKTQLFGITNLAAFLYQTGMSMADSSLQLVLNRFGVPEPVTLTLMSGGAAQQAVYDAKERGASDGQALLAGYAAGIAEYAFEKISLDNLAGSIEAKAGETIGEKLTEKWVSKLAKKVGPWIINAGKQGLVEGSEEAFTTLANTVTDLMINGDKSELLKDIDEMGTGPALRKWITGLALDAMGGIISGVGMGAGGSVLRYAGGVAEDAASAARAAAEKESGQAQAETPTEPETRTALPTPSESNPLAKALDKLRSGEQLTKNDARRIMEDEASMQTLRDAGLARGIRPGGDGIEQIRQAVESYARLNTNLLTQAQAQGNLETNTEEVVSNGRTVETPDRAAAETAGEQQPQTSFRERARAVAETQRSREILDREERRSGLGRFLAEYRANRAQRSAQSQFDEQKRRANSLRNQAEARNLTFTSAAEQGVPGGTEDQTFQVMPADMLDRNMRTAQQEAAKNGIDLRFMIGQGRVNDSSGNYNFRGWISADGKRMLIQADHSKLTWQQILDHEELHKLIKSAPGYREAVEDALLSDARLQPYLSSIVDRYAEAYNSLGVTDENEIIEELLADYRAGFDMLDIARGKAGDVRTKAAARKDIRAAEKRGVVPVKNNRGAQTQGSASTEITGNRFSMEMPVEETADLIAVHNLTERNLIDMGELGGAPAPSIAIVKAEAGHTKYGPISLVYTKGTIDPQRDRRNKVYGADAWTPTAPRVDYELDYDGVIRLEEQIDKLSKSIASGMFGNSSILRQAGVDDSTTMNVDELAEKLASTDAVKAAYLADHKGTLDAAKKAKQWNKYGNDTLQKFIDRIGPQRLAQIIASLEDGQRTLEALGSERETILQILRDYYQEAGEAYLQKRAQRNGWTKEEAETRRQKQIDTAIENNVSLFTLETFARDAWAMYEDGGATTGENDYYATQDALRQAVSDSEAEEWIKPKLEALYGKPWLYNGKDPYTASGNRRSFRQLHDAYTLENIVKAMSSQQSQRGEGLWGATATGLQATATPSYRSIADIKADSGRLGAVNSEEYNAQVSAVDEELTELINEIVGPGAHFSEREIAGSLLVEAAHGAKTVAAIRSLFAKESDLKVSEATAKKIQRVFQHAAKLPTEYFEAKPMRAVGFDEIAAAVVPSDISAQARKVLDDNGVNTLEYRSGDDADRLAKLNSIQDVKFSRELDRDYLAAVESGDMDTAQRMVDEAARAAGYTIKAYHGTTDDFTKFSRGEQGRNHDGYLEFGGGFYFTPNENEAREWVRRGRSGLSGKAEPKVMSVYLSPRNIINADEPIPRGADALQRMGMSKADANFIAGRTYRFINYLAEDKGFSNTEIQDELKSLGYDAIDATYRNTASGQYVVFDPEQIKSADPVTYDNQGNVIPLSERFNPEEKDIRYSREIDPQEAALNSPETIEQRQVAGLMRENEELKKALQKWKAQVKASDRTQPREADVRRMAKDLLNTYTSEADGDHVTEALRELAHTIMSNGTRWTDVRDQAVRLASDILDKSSELVDAGEAEFYREIRRTIKGYKIAFTQKNDIPDYNEWRKANFGRLTISKDGTPVDVLWEELQDTYGRGFFPDDIINPTDQILYLADLWDRLQDPYANPYRANMAEAVQLLASDIIDRVIGDEIRQAPTTYADRAQERVARATLKGELRAQKIKERLEEERQRRKKDLADLKEHYKTKEAKGRESRKARELRAKITKHANDMTDRLLHPTDKKHVPEALRQPVAAVLSAIDLGSAYSYAFDSDGNFKRVPRGLELGAEETKRTQAFQQVREALLKEAGDLVLDPELMGTIEEPGSLTRLVTDLANVPIASMNAEQLQVVYDALRGIEGAVRSANRMLSQARWAAVSDAADAFKAENAAKTAPLELNGPLGRVEDLTRLDMLTPEAYFHRFGKSGQAIFGMLRSAQDAFIVNMANATEATKKIVGNTDVSALERETHTVTMDGQDVTMTTAQIMELYCLMQRDQGLQHITTGGIMIEPARQGLKKTTQAEPLHPSMEELLNAVKLLTPEELRLADELQKYLSVDMAELGNEATMQVYGYNKFGQEEKYWKIRSNKNEITQSIEKETQTTSVANRGFTKPVNPQANTSVKIGSIFDTYSQSVNDMATYAAWLAVGEDVNRIRNYTFRDDEGKRIGTVKGILDRVIGSGGANYLQRLMADIANGAGMDDAGLTAGFVGAYKAAAIGANVRVIIQQPTAIIRAAEMIDPKYLASGLKNPMKAFERAKKYSPIAQWKDWGYFDINTGRKMKDVLFENSSKLEKVRQASMAMAGKADSFAWGQLWGAVEAETKDKTDLKPGTSDFYEACAERFNAIIDHTQVVDGILQRSQIMRSKNAITRMAVSFMSEPTKQYNQFMSAVYDYKHSGDKKQAKQMMARTVFSMLAAGVANVLAQSLIDALRDDDREKKYWEKLLEKFFGYNPDDKTFGEKLKTFAFSNMGELINPASYLPYAKDIMSIIQGYSVDRMDMDAISDTITAMTRLYKALNGEGKQTAAYSIVKLTEQAAKLLGLPAYNLDRDVTSLFTTIINDADIPVLQYYLNRYRYKPPESGNLSANLKGILWDAKQKGDGSYSIIAGHLLKDGYTQETIDKAMTAMLSDESGYTAAQKAADAAGDNNGSYNLAEKLEAFSSLTLSEEDRDTLLEAKLSDTQYAQYVVLQRYSDYDTWLSVMMDMPDSSPTQAEIEAVLDTRDELTTTQKAAYWQVLSKATTAKNNPYSQEVGQEILDAKASGGGSGGDKDRAPASTSGLRLPVVESTRRVDSGLRLPTVEHVEARPSSGLKLPTK